MHFFKTSPEDSDAHGHYNTALGDIRGVTLLVRQWVAFYISTNVGLVERTLDLNRKAFSNFFLLLTWVNHFTSLL